MTGKATHEGTPANTAPARQVNNESDRASGACTETLATEKDNALFAQRNDRGYTRAALADIEVR